MNNTNENKVYTKKESDIICDNITKLLELRPELKAQALPLINGKRYEYPFKIIDDIISKNYIFTESSLSHFATLLSVSKDTLLSTNETNAVIAAWGGKETEGTLQAPIKEQTT